MEKTAAERLSALIQIPTVAVNIDSTGVAPFERLIETLRYLYPRMHQELVCERVTELGLVFHWKGTDESLADQPVVLMAHFDVVPASGSDPWTYPPFEGRIADEKVWGRGALDDKAGLACVCEAVESLLVQGFTPRRDVYLSFGGDEETGGTAAAAIAARFEQQGLRPYLVLDEGGAITDAPLSWVKVRTAMIGVAEKGVMTVRLDVKADPGHASTPSEHTAITHIGRAVARLTESTFPAHVPATTMTMLAILARHTSGARNLLLSRLAKSPRLTGRILTRLGGEAASLAHTTIAPTMIEGGTAANVLPSHASAHINVRIAVGETTGSALARIIRRIGDPKVKVKMVAGSEPSREAPTDGAQFAAIRQAVEASYPGVVSVPYVMMAATDSRHFHAFTDTVYRFAPLVMTADQRASIHGVNEYVEIDCLERGRKFFEHLIRVTSGSPAHTTLA